jgi:hypothetical protein
VHRNDAVLADVPTCLVAHSSMRCTALAVLLLPGKLACACGAPHRDANRGGDVSSLLMPVASKPALSPQPVARQLLGTDAQSCGASRAASCVYRGPLAPGAGVERACAMQVCAHEQGGDVDHDAATRQDRRQGARPRAPQRCVPCVRMQSVCPATRGGCSSTHGGAAPWRGAIKSGEGHGSFGWKHRRNRAHAWHVRTNTPLLFSTSC